MFDRFKARASSGSALLAHRAFGKSERPQAGSVSLGFLSFDFADLPFDLGCLASA